jgi:hypothetical protein
VIGVRELADPAGPAAAPLLDEDGAIVRPLLAVDLDGAGPVDVAAAARAAARSERILVGIGTSGTHPLAAALDLTLTAAPTADRACVRCAPEVALAEIDAAAAAYPLSALVLVGLLRWSGTLPVPAALDAESLAYSTLLGGREFAGWLARRGPLPPPPEAGGDAVLVERAGDVLTITLNRPGRRNAYGREVRDGLVAALRLARLEGLRVELRGAGPVFSSGGDLAEFGTAPDLATAHVLRTRAGAGALLHELADRTTAHLHGACVGAGIELPAFAGTVLAAPGTLFRLPELGMGLIPGAGGTVSIPRRIGRWRTLHLALTAGSLDLDTALAWGLVDGRAG